MKRIQRPIGVYVMTILLVFGAGILPLLHVAVLIQEARQQSDIEISFTLVFVSIFLPVFSLASAIWAFVGHNEGRIAVLIFVSLNFLWWMFLALINIANSDEEILNGVLFLIGFIRPVVMFGLFWWYFTKKDVVAYYKQVN